jgi:threonylcarbamoyladenosine tRNA methylthiotransferase MtaB
VDGSRADSVAVVALGCRVGRADAGSVLSGLAPGFRAATPGEAADWVVVSTCTVTADAAASSRQAVRRAARQHPGARIVVAGCHASLEARLLAALPGVAAVVDPADHPALPDLLALLRRGAGGREAIVAARSAAPAWSASPRPGTGAARPVLKVQDGCDDACAYCAVPMARGASRSLPIEDCLSRISVHGLAGAEVVVSGVHLGAWGRDLSPRLGLADLVRAAASRRAVGRIRLSSIEPMEFPVGLLGEDSGAILCEHFHLPLQSGSDRVLASMGRPYTAAAYARVVEGVARRRPGAAIGADVMAGFPGESEEDHRATLALLSSLPLAYLHVFAFSPRPGTRAAAMGGRPPSEVAGRRAGELRDLGAARWSAFQDGLRGRELEVVVERIRGAEASGTSREYATVRFPAHGAIRGARARVRAGDADVRLGSKVARAAAPS